MRKMVLITLLVVLSSTPLGWADATNCWIEGLPNYLNNECKETIKEETDRRQALGLPIWDEKGKLYSLEEATLIKQRRDAEQREAEARIQQNQKKQEKAARRAAFRQRLGYGLLYGSQAFSQGMQQAPRTNGTTCYPVGGTVSCYGW